MYKREQSLVIYFGCGILRIREFMVQEIYRNINEGNDKMQVKGEGEKINKVIK